MLHFSQGQLEGAAAVSRRVLLRESGRELGPKFWMLVWEDAAQLGV